MQVQPAGLFLQKIVMATIVASIVIAYARIVPETADRTVFVFTAAGQDYAAHATDAWTAVIIAIQSVPNAEGR